MHRGPLMNKKLGFAAALGLTVFLAACGNGNGTLGSGSGGGGGGGGGGTATVQLGSGSGSSFQQGVLAVAVPNLSAGGSTTISATLQNSDGTAYTQSATITFTSPCYGNNLAAFSSGGTQTNQVTTTTGQANITYSATGCSGTDTITATASVGGSNLSATGVVTVAPASVGSIQFVSATPDTIYLLGSGGPSTSTVVFKVTDSTGGAVPNAHVVFTSNTSVGGITLSPSSATTGNDGEVQTVLQAGTQHTTVRITAQTTSSGGTTISTQSPGIAISTGIPTQGNFSLSIANHDVEGWSVNGVTDTVSVYLSDRFHNPVPDGTSVAFTTNGGQIQPSCTTTGGTCSVTWTSADSRPAGPPSEPLSVVGHAEILAYATGEESFVDTNGDGIFDQGDQFHLYPGWSGSTDQFFGQPTQDDIGEVYLDQNENGQYDPGEYFFDFNHNGQRDPPDHKFHGTGCSSANNPPAPCGSSNFGIGLQDCIVMATSQVLITGPATLNAGQTATYEVTDLNGNMPPAGMTFSIVASGAGASVLQTTMPDSGCIESTPPAAYGLSVSVNPNSQPGSFIIEAVSPVSNTISYSQSIQVP